MQIFSRFLPMLILIGSLLSPAAAFAQGRKSLLAGLSKAKPARSLARARPSRRLSTRSGSTNTPS
jgi:hypothetical protein